MISRYIEIDKKTPACEDSTAQGEREASYSTT